VLTPERVVDGDRPLSTAPPTPRDDVRTTSFPTSSATAWLIAIRNEMAELHCALPCTDGLADRSQSTGRVASFVTA
jgi:hypothetical protein